MEKKYLSEWKRAKDFLKAAKINLRLNELISDDIEGKRKIYKQAVSIILKR